MAPTIPVSRRSKCKNRSAKGATLRSDGGHSVSLIDLLCAARGANQRGTDRQGRLGCRNAHGAACCSFGNPGVENCVSQVVPKLGVGRSQVSAQFLVPVNEQFQVQDESLLAPSDR
jgi:hypothetical protein